MVVVGVSTSWLSNGAAETATLSPRRRAVVDVKRMISFLVGFSRWEISQGENNRDEWMVRVIYINCEWLVPYLFCGFFFPSREIHDS